LLPVEKWKRPVAIATDYISRAPMEKLLIGLQRYVETPSCADAESSARNTRHANAMESDENACE